MSENVDKSRGIVLGVVSGNNLINNELWEMIKNIRRYSPTTLLLGIIVSRSSCVIVIVEHSWLEDQLLLSILSDHWYSFVADN